MITARVTVVKGWGREFARDTAKQAIKALEEASELGAESVAQLGSQRRRGGEMSQAEPVRAYQTESGFAAGFRSKAGTNGEFYSGFQSRGTLGARSRKVKQSTVARRESPSGKARYEKVKGRKGITPLLHEERALTIAKRHLIRLLERLR